MGHYSLTASSVYQSEKCTLFVTGNCNGTIYFTEITNRGSSEGDEVPVSSINLYSSKKLVRLNYKLFQGDSPVLWLAKLIHNQKVVSSNLVSSNIIDGNGVKAMPGLIPAHNSGSL